ncbi:O-antigen ligase family protein [Oceanobacillus luteolus]|uniref:O-antigen ligase family protein n=1 Tax=Oceanobacillus luteolus TaxID=1274358 RepID=A0ABW4HNJ9_9BACI
MIDQWSSYSNIALAASCIGIVIIYFFNYKSIKIPRKVTLVFSLFLFFTLFSSLVNGSLQMVLSTSRYLLVFIALCIIVPNLLKEKTMLFSISTLLISQLPLLILSIIEENPFNNLSGVYLGLFYNSNSFGLYSSTITVVLLTLIFRFAGTKKILTQVTLIFFLFIFFLLTTLSGSRTSVVSIIIIFLVMMALRIFENININQISLKKVRNGFVGLVAISVLIILFVDSKYYQIFYERIIEKFISKSSSGDVLDNRGDILIETITDANLFGHGPEYFIQNFGIGAHNSFVSILGQFGLLATIVFIIFWLNSMIKSLKYYFVSNNNFRFLPIAIVIFFIVTSMAEIMLMKVSMLLAFIVIGVINLDNISKNIIKRT